jgi:hypothetical protein
VISHRFYKREVAFLVFFVFNDQSDVVEVAACQPPTDTLSESEATEKKYVAGLDVLQEFFFGYATIFPEVFFRYKFLGLVSSNST